MRKSERDTVQVGSWARPQRSGTAGPPRPDKLPATAKSRSRPAPPTEPAQAEATRATEAEPNRRNLAGTLGLLFGLVSLALMALLPPLGLVAALLGVGFGCVGRARVARGEASNRGQAVIGLVCAAVGVAVSGTLVVSEAIYLAGHPALVRSLSGCVKRAGTAQARNACVQRLTKAIEGRP